MTKANFKSTFYTIVLLLFFTPFVIGQTITVISLEDSQPIPGARITVQLNEKTYNFTTPINGELNIDKALTQKPLTMTISFMSYETKKLERLVISKDTAIALAPAVRQFDEVAITAQYKSQLVEKAVHNIKVIDRQKIDAMAAQDLKDVLTNELNVRLGEDNILGSSMQLQGIGGENVKILVDGVPLTGRLNGNIDLSQIPLESIERIEIVEGPLSVSYGTDALAGTINIITKKNQGKKFEVNSNNYFESSGKVNNTVSLGWQIKKHQIRLEGGRYFFDGWDPSHEAFHYNPKPIADSSRSLQWNPKEQIFGGINYRYNRKNTLFNYSGQLFNENIINRGMPRPPYQQAAYDDYYKTNRVNQRANFQYRFKDNYRLSFIAAYNGYFRQKNTKVRDLTDISDVISGNPSDHDTSQYHSFISRGSLIQTKSNKKINYEIGYDILYEIARGERILDGQQAIGDYAIYATAEYSPFKSLIIRPGIRYGYNSEYTSPVTPSLNIKYDLLQNDKQQLSLRASYARGFRAPSIKELHYVFVDINHNIVGNPDLEAEYANHFNLSLHQNIQLKDVKLKNKAVLFYNDIHQLITLAQASATEYSYFNLDRYTTTGIQLESNLNYKNITAGAGVGYIGRYNDLAEENSNSTDFLFSPEVKFNLQYNWEKIGLQTAVFYKYTGVLPNIRMNADGELYESKISDYHMADLTVSKFAWNKKLKFTMGVKNLFNVTSITGSASGEGAHSVSSGSVSIGMGRVYHFGIRLNINSK
ncbi:TonB-dependent receptor [Brumimicrobium glaciale]|uniref:TonB-dependent receptor n=1 Tax=Brumimicrobium glaciale TaxID=200475 RepID=A0A4Q4KQ34_9FLAO|nr:TonB-dependent receptor [Brumimicrobium glaciale]RYM35150.1 TonB-dependent receptor [Brumimicrobium glaciale]